MVSEIKKRTMGELLIDCAKSIKVAGVETIETDQGNILDVTLWAMEEAHVLQINVQVADEALDRFDFGDGGSAIQKGLQRLSDHLRQSGEDE